MPPFLATEKGGAKRLPLSSTIRVRESGFMVHPGIILEL